MTEIALREPDLIATVADIVEVEGRTAAEFVNDAVRKAIAAYRQRQIAAETDAWYQIPAAERRTYAEQFVAVYQGKIVDSDRERMTLFKRVRKSYGSHRPVLIIQGGDDPIPTYKVSSVRAV